MWIRRIVNVFRSDELSSDIERELTFHIRERAESLMSAGMPEREAWIAARKQFGNEDSMRERTRDRDVVQWVDTFTSDIRFAARSLVRNRGFAVIALLSLAVGIGANTAIFSVVDTALLRPLPYASPDQLVHIWETHHDGQERSEASYPDYLDWRVKATGFSALEAYEPSNVTMTADGSSAMVRGARVTGGFFELLGTQAQLGRLLRPGEDALASANVVVLSDDLWRRDFGASTAVVGRDMLVNGVAYRIIGVLPRGFRFAPAGDAQMWMPINASAERRGARGNHWVNVIGRLRDGTAAEVAVSQLTSVMNGLAIEHPETNSGRGIEMEALRDVITGDLRSVFVALSFAVALLLLIACANVAGLLLARGVARTQEMAVRSALGTGRGRLIRQLLTESAVLAVFGGALGIWLGHAGMSAALRAVPESVLDRMPYLRDVHLDGRLILFGIVATLLTTLLAGLLPAMGAAGASGYEALRQGTRTIGSRTRLRDALVCGEIAVTVTLLTGAGLMARSVGALLDVDAGFKATHVLTGRVALAGPAYADAAAQQRFFESLLTGLRALPGAPVVGAVTNLPLNPGGTNTFRVEGLTEPDAAQRPEAVMRGIAGDYFGAMQIPVISGRALTARDDSTSENVIVINRALEKQYFGGAPAVGRLVRFYAFPEQAWRVVGVAGDVRTNALDEEVPPTVYYSHLQGAENRMTLTIRTDNTAEATLGIREVLRALDPAVALYSVQTMASQIANSEAVFARKYPLLGLRLFSYSALGLALIGLYGLMSFSVRQRRREFGIRTALGAGRGQIAWPVLRHALFLAFTGFAGGILGSIALSKLLSTLLFGVSASDPATFVQVGVVLVVTIAAGAWLPVRYALRVPPSDVLRTE